MKFLAPLALASMAIAAPMSQISERLFDPLNLDIRNPSGINVIADVDAFADKLEDSVADFKLPRNLATARSRPGKANTDTVNKIDGDSPKYTVSTGRPGGTADTVNKIDGDAPKYTVSSGRPGGTVDTVNKLPVETLRPTPGGIKKKPTRSNPTTTPTDPGSLAARKIPRGLGTDFFNGVRGGKPNLDAIKTAGLNIFKNISDTVKQKLELLPRFTATDLSGLGKVEKIARDLSYDDAEYSQAVKDFLKSRQDDDSLVARGFGFIGREDAGTTGP